MRIVLLKDVRDIGKKGEVKEVKEGYARNFLIAKGLVRAVTEEVLKGVNQANQSKKETEAKRAELLSRAAKQIEGKVFEFRLKSDSRGSVFGSVTKDQIIKNILTLLSLKNEKAEIVPSLPIRSFGDHEIQLVLDQKVKAKVIVRVQPQL